MPPSAPVAGGRATKVSQDRGGRDIMRTTGRRLKAAGTLLAAGLGRSSLQVVGTARATAAAADMCWGSVQSCDLPGWMSRRAAVVGAKPHAAAVQGGRRRQSVLSSACTVAHCPNWTLPSNSQRTNTSSASSQQQPRSLPAAAAMAQCGLAALPSLTAQPAAASLKARTALRSQQVGGATLPAACLPLHCSLAAPPTCLHRPSSPPWHVRNCAGARAAPGGPGRAAGGRPAICGGSGRRRGGRAAGAQC